jgi:hypothetical protein
MTAVVLLTLMQARRSFWPTQPGTIRGPRLFGWSIRHVPSPSGAGTLAARLLSLKKGRFCGSSLQRYPIRVRADH